MAFNRSGGVIQRYQLALVNGLLQSEYVIYYIAAFTTAVCHEPNARFMFHRNTPFPI